MIEQDKKAEESSTPESGRKLLESTAPAHDPLLAGALERGLEASYKVRSGGFLGGNFEERLRVGLLAALEYYRSAT